MAKTKWKTAAVLGVSILLIIGTAVSSLWLSRNRHYSIREDKPFVRLVSVAVGTNFSCRLNRSPPWIQTPLRLLPASLGSFFDAWFGMGSGALSLVSYRGATNVAVFTANQQRSGGGGPEALIAFDSQGNSFMAAHGGGSIGSDDGRWSRSIKGWVLQAFPRRTRTLGLRFVGVGSDHKTWQPLAEFYIRNPLFGNYPVWVAEPVPVTKVDGDLRVTLTALQTGISLEDPSRAAQTNETAATRAIFQVQQAGQPNTSWRPKMIEVSDATGNRWSPFIPAESHKQMGNLADVMFVGALWPGEAAWRLRVEFSHETDFEPAELWTVRGLRVPQAGEILDLENTTTNQSRRLSLVAFTGADADQPGSFRWLMQKGEPRLSIRSEPALEGWRLSLIRAVDDHRREVEVEPSQDWGWSGDEKVFGLKLKPDASSVDCIFALHKSRFVEFLAHPTFAAP